MTAEAGGSSAAPASPRTIPTPVAGPYTPGPMRILFDGYWWARGPQANRAVQRDLITTWVDAFPEDEVTVAVRHEHAAENLHPGGSVEFVTTRLWPHALSNLTELPLLARHVGAEITVAHNYTPLSGRTATFIHDVMFVEHPEWFSRPERAYFWPMLPSAKRANGIFTSTATEAARIENSLARRRSVTATGLAVPTSLLNATPSPPPDAPAPGSFALCVGRLNIRKNLAAVIRGAVASNVIDPAHPLMIVGSSEHSGRGTSIPDEFRAAVESGTVRFLGRTPDGQLAWLYANTALTICLSLDEGFGLPSIEAAQFGSPLVASDIPVFRETVGGYATLVDPLAPAHAVGQAIDRTWAATPSLEARRAISARYNWTSAVDALRESIAALR